MRRILFMMIFMGVISWHHPIIPINLKNKTVHEIHVVKGTSLFIPDGEGGGILKGPNGISTVVPMEDGKAVIYGPNGTSTFIADGEGGGTLINPDGSSKTICDLNAGGSLYGPAWTFSVVPDDFEANSAEMVD